MDVKADVMPKAYLFWYKSSEYAKTEYFYIIAFSVKQACLFYVRQGYTRMYDYDTTPCDAIPAQNWKARHEIGEILGQYAII